MANVVAIEKGFFGGSVRAVGERFVVPDDLWNDKKRRPRWCKLAGKADGPAGKADAKVTTVVVPPDWADLPAKDRKALAKAISGEDAPNAHSADAIIELYVATVTDKPEVFGDAPEPQTVADAQKAIGGVQPDWVAPSGPPKAVRA